MHGDSADELVGCSEPSLSSLPAMLYELLSVCVYVCMQACMHVCINTYMYAGMDVM